MQRARAETPALQCFTQIRVNRTRTVPVPVPVPTPILVPEGHIVKSRVSHGTWINRCVAISVQSGI
jgi:hypothetical protein